MNLPRAAIALVVATVVFTGCAEGPVVREERLGRDAYLDQVAETQDRIADSSALLAGRAIIGDPEPGDAQDIIDGVDAATDDLAAELPPKEWEDEHRQLVEALRDWQEGLGEVAAGQASEDQATFDAGKAKVEAAEVRIRAATEQMVADVERDAGDGSA